MRTLSFSAFAAVVCGRLHWKPCCNHFWNSVIHTLLNSTIWSKPNPRTRKAMHLWFFFLQVYRQEKPISTVSCTTMNALPSLSNSYTLWLHFHHCTLDYYGYSFIIVPTITMITYSWCYFYSCSYWAYDMHCNTTIIYCDGLSEYNK